MLAVNTVLKGKQSNFVQQSSTEQSSYNHNTNFEYRCRHSQFLHRVLYATSPADSISTLLCITIIFTQKQKFITTDSPLIKF